MCRCRRAEPAHHRVGEVNTRWRACRPRRRVGNGLRQPLGRLLDDRGHVINGALGFVDPQLRRILLAAQLVLEAMHVLRDRPAVVHQRGELMLDAP